MVSSRQLNPGMCLNMGEPGRLIWWAVREKALGPGIRFQRLCSPRETKTQVRLPPGKQCANNWSSGSILDLGILGSVRIINGRVAGKGIAPEGNGSSG